MINPELPNFYYLAMQAAIKASEIISQVYAEDVSPTIKSDGSPVTKADLEASAIIEEMLKPTGIPILGEELEKESFEVRSKWTENWCVDPLDGTQMFLQKNGEFSVNIAHVKGQNAIFGIIANPLMKQLLIGGPAYGAYLLDFDQLNDRSTWQELTPHTIANDPIAIICSRGYREAHGSQLMAEYLANSASVYIHKGSALKFFDLAIGRADIYPRLAPTMEWDIAAGQAILETLGGAVIDVHTKEPLVYNKESLYNPYFIAMTQALMT